MTNQITVPNHAIKYILFQRTEYLRFPKTFFYRILNRLLPFSIYSQVVAIEGKFRASRVKALYEDAMRKEYLSIKSFLPKTCSAVLDIGCGVAGIDVFINSHYAAAQINFYLLDKTHIEEDVYYSFDPRGAFYNSLEVAKAMLTGNGIPDSYVHLIEATDNNDIEIDSKVDLVISLISWGFHYPVETYLDEVCNVLDEGGSVILDVRRGTDGLDVLKRKLCEVGVITEERKYHRVIAIK